MSNKIKVVGYAQKQVFNGNIEYRNFSPDLVGGQSTDGNSTFTLGNFVITTTLDAKPSKIFTTNKFSDFISLSELDLTLEETQFLLDNNSEVKLKLDKTDLNNYAYFGSLLEYMRVSLEEIITKWPASIHPNPIKDLASNNLTVEDYIYDALRDEATFKVDVDIIRNQYQVNFLQNGTIIDTFNEENDLRNLTVNFLSYSVLRDDIEYPLLEFTGSTQITDDFIFLKVKGDPFSDITGMTATTAYHIKPNKLKEDEFFNALPDFESNLLNRFTVPQYSSTYKFPERTEGGSIIHNTRTLIWPVTDGYNIDFDSTEYLSFVSDLIEISTDFDENKTNLMVRFLTAEAISDFDTIPNCDGEQEDTAGQKMNKTLKIYGREYDELKRRIDGIQYANTVSYDQLNNTPDATLKNLARTMGWELVSSVLENDLLKNYVTSTQSTYSGASIGLTAVEAEVELWRRLILNSPWLWKSKGARKSIEFLFKFIGAPDGLIEFNEFIYMAQNTIDVDLFIDLLEKHGLDTDLSLYNVDSDGYPRVLNNTTDMYFQKGGLWYRQTAGSGATIDILTGNNPHVGPYDGGAAYINQFNSLIPGFSATTITSTTVTTGTTNLFTNYEHGTINSYSGTFFVDVVSDNSASLDDCIVVTSSKVEDPFPTASELTDCGCIVDEDDFALKLDIGCNLHNETPISVRCKENLIGVSETVEGAMLFTYNQLDEFGDVITGSSRDTTYISNECCTAFGGNSYYDEDWSKSFSNNGKLLNCGYVCCKTGKCGCGVTCDWELSTATLNNMPVIAPYSQRFLVFRRPDAVKTSVTPTGCSCIAGYTTPVNITDPNTGEVGVGCALTSTGEADLNGSSNNKYYFDFNTTTNTFNILTWQPTFGGSRLPIVTNTPPLNSFDSFIEAVYSGRVDGKLDCTQYMNTGVTPKPKPTLTTTISPTFGGII